MSDKEVKAIPMKNYEDDSPSCPNCNSHRTQRAVIVVDPGVVNKGFTVDGVWCQCCMEIFNWLGSSTHYDLTEWDDTNVNS